MKKLQMEPVPLHNVTYIMCINILVRVNESSSSFILKHSIFDSNFTVYYVSNYKYGAPLTILLFRQSILNVSD